MDRTVPAAWNEWGIKGMRDSRGDKEKLGGLINQRVTHLLLPVREIRRHLGWDYSVRKYGILDREVAEVIVTNVEARNIEFNLDRQGGNFSRDVAIMMRMYELQGIDGDVFEIDDGAIKEIQDRVEEVLELGKVLEKISVFHRRETGRTKIPEEEIWNTGCVMVLKVMAAHWICLNRGMGKTQNKYLAGVIRYVPILVLLGIGCCCAKRMFER